MTEPDCISCHQIPPNTPSNVLTNRPNREGAHEEHSGLTARTFTCVACHFEVGSETAELLRETITWKIRKLPAIRATLTLMAIEGQE